MSQNLDAAYWNQRYQQQQTGWDIGSCSTPLATYFDQLTDKHLRILIPGCGNAYEAAYLLDKGFTNITVVDIAPLVTATIQQQLSVYGSAVRVLTADFFDMQEQFDLIVEQTFFCALHPDLRSRYVVKMHELLHAQGKLVGVLFNRSFEGGPPFGGSIEEYTTLFTARFQLQTLAPCYNSIAPRSGSEVFLIARPA
ncbi:MAG TPA: SAM-dependent methyltransferase [Chitinophagaceae bacterium]|nr:SAM-dependent methyltransferase [Chitinophagaceae bacterium]HAN39211.1 SAM-dependent methyltransferase [Chitinophagaceae bacterium]